MKRPHWQLCLLVIYMVGMLSVSRAQPCTVSTCAGPVRVNFQSVDCTGTGDFIEIVASTKLGVCQRGVATSTYIYSTDDFLWQQTFSSNLDCDSVLENSTYVVSQEYYGVCAPVYSEAKRGATENLGERSQTMTRAATSSYMILPNASAPYTSPQSLAISLEYIDADLYSFTAPCASGTYCTRPNGDQPAIIFSNTVASSCAPSTSTGLYNYMANATCYRQGDLNHINTECLETNAYVDRFYTGDGCQHLYLAKYYRRPCIDDYPSPISIITCIGAPEPVPISVPVMTPFNGAPNASPNESPSGESPSGSPSGGPPPNGSPSGSPGSPPSGLPPTSTPTAPTTSVPPSSTVPSTSSPASTAPSLLPSFLLLIFASILALLF